MPGRSPNNRKVDAAMEQLIRTLTNKPGEMSWNYLLASLNCLKVLSPSEVASLFNQVRVSDVIAFRGIRGDFMLSAREIEAEKPKEPLPQMHTPVVRNSTVHLTTQLRVAIDDIRIAATEAGAFGLTLTALQRTVPAYTKLDNSQKNILLAHLRQSADWEVATDTSVSVPGKPPTTVYYRPAALVPPSESNPVIEPKTTPKESETMSTTNTPVTATPAPAAVPAMAGIPPELMAGITELFQAFTKEQQQGSTAALTEQFTWLGEKLERQAAMVRSHASELESLVAKHQEAQALIQSEIAGTMAAITDLLKAAN